MLIEIGNLCPNCSALSAIAPICLAPGVKNIDNSSLLCIHRRWIVTSLHPVLCIQSKDELSIFFTPGARHIGAMAERAEQLGQKLPISISIGVFVGAGTNLYKSKSSSVALCTTSWQSGFLSVSTGGIGLSTLL